MTDDWLSFLPEAEQLDPDRRTAEKLANVIARVPGDREEKVRFFLDQQTFMADYVESVKGIDPAREPKRFGAAMRSAAFSFWRKHYNGPAREKPQMTLQGRRGGLRRIGE